MLSRLTAWMLGAVALAVLAAAPASAGTKQADAQLDQSMQQLVSTPNGPPGLAVVVQRGNKRRLHTAGVSKLGDPSPIELNQFMRIASVSKTFSGAVSLLLVQRHQLSLGDTIGTRLPGLPAAWSQVTLRQLLQHTSGLPSYTSDPEFLRYFGDHLQGYISPVQAISFVFDEPLEFTPGTRYEYSNSDNIVIALMAQAATGRTYEQLIHDLVTRRLKLRHTSLPNGFAMPAPFVTGYVSDGSGPPEDVSQDISVSSVWASGGIVSTPKDLNTFIRAWGSGSFLDRKLRRAQTRFIPGAAGEPPGPGANSGGLTLYRYQLPCGTVFGHTGNFPGYTQFAASSKDGSRSVVVTANLQLDVRAGPPGIFDLLRGVFAEASCTALAGRG